MSGLKQDFSGMTLEQLQQHAQFWTDAQRLCNWAIGDLARKGRSMGEDALHQLFPENTSPSLIARCEKVALAYPNDDDRNPLATWSIHMQNANRPDRIERVQAHVDAGRTSDEARKANQEERATAKARWLIAFDIHYFVHRHYYSGAGVETAMQVSEWAQRTLARLKDMGATDAVFAFEGVGSFRKELTAGDEWEGERYKDRPGKPDDLRHQLQLTRTLLDGLGFACVSEDGYEADDILASYAAQFPGRITIVSADKDLRSALSDHCNMLLDIEWIDDETTGELVPDYKWLSAKQHTEQTGIRPDQWAEWQAIAGDSVDGVKGAPGIGTKGATDLMKEFGSLEAVFEAARNEHESIKPKKREALLQLAERIDVVRQLVTMRTDVKVPMGTRI